MYLYLSTSAKLDAVSRFLVCSGLFLGRPKELPSAVIEVTHSFLTLEGFLKGTIFAGHIQMFSLRKEVIRLHSKRLETGLTVAL